MDNQSGLTPRQRQCLEAREQRMTAKEVARALAISPHTVAMHWRLARMKIAADRARSATLCPHGDKDESDPPTTDGAWFWLGAAVLLFGAVSFVMTLLGLLLLAYSPWFAHLRLSLE